MERTVKLSKNEQIFYTVNLESDSYEDAKEWCLKHRSKGKFYLIFACEPETWETIVQFGFTFKEDFTLFSMIWSSK